jgi:hypothetical protein
MRVMTVQDKLMSVKHVVVGVVVASLLLTVFVGVAQAVAAGPVWQVTAGFAPTNLGSPKSEVQEIETTVGVSEGGLHVDGQFVGELVEHETAAEVQSLLEGPYGAGNVEVSGGPTGANPLIVRSIGALAGKAVPNIEARNFGPGGLITRVLTQGGSGQIVVLATNLGDAEASGASPNTPVSVTDKLPAGLEATGISGTAGTNGHGGTVVCPPVSDPALVSCEFSGSLPPYDFVEITIDVNVVGSISAENEVSVAGGGAAETSALQPVKVSSEPTPFGIEAYELTPTNEDGSPDTQAGSHPFQLTTTLSLNKVLNNGLQAPAGLARDLQFQLPPGLIGDATAVPQCTALQFTTGEVTCPEDTKIGMSTVTAIIPGNLFGFDGPFTKSVPMFNLVPGSGEPARFGFSDEGIRVLLNTSVRTGGDYGVTVDVNDITQEASFLRDQVTFWGVPGAPSHCATGACAPLVQAPLLTLPTACSSTLETTAEGDSWPALDQPSELASPISYRLPGGLTGCNHLPFGGEIEVAPDGRAASTPTGLKVDVHVPQEATLNPSGLAVSDVKDITVALPEGVVLNPAGADGLDACSEAQIGFLGKAAGEPEANLFTSTVQTPFCPDASKIGEVSIRTPLLPNPLKGAVYLAAQNENPFGSLVAMYIVAEDPVSGVLVKLPGEVALNQETGQITATIKNSPELPFEDAELHFFGGSRAPLASPAHCGAYTTDASLAPWSGSAAVSATSSFEIASGPSGGPCPGVLPFAPSLTAGTTSNQAGGFSALTTTISREDGSQNIQAVELHMPAGLLGVLSGVKLCGEAQANAGTCGPESLIGHTTVSVGLGNEPYSVTGGEVFLTEGYEGAPFGLSIVNPAVAGPFDLGKVIVRSKIEVDPHTAALTITTGAIPHILDGIPLQIKHINVTIDRPGFTFNPTSCDPLQVTGGVSSVEGASSAVEVPFQVTNCAALAFRPKFVASTSGMTSKAKGASLSVKLTYPSGPLDANIAKVKVDLPKQLPSRLTTLQKACTAAQFEANPAGCPTASVVGHAKAITPVLPVPLEGPAYFVSHGGEAFPSLIVVLQGYGVTVDLVGTTFISKAGITSSTFKSVPDVPVGTFELTLPEGSFSALAANLPTKARSSFCSRTLAMPTAFVAQNGVEIHESTKIAVTGCRKAKKANKKKKLKGKKAGGKKPRKTSS